MFLTKMLMRFLRLDREEAVANSGGAPGNPGGFPIESDAVGAAEPPAG